MKNKVEKMVGKKLNDMVKLHGDASYREYFRAFLSDGTTRIIMKMPQGKASVSEEITNFKGIHKEIPFINVCKYLAGLGLPVPNIVAYDPAERLMVLEDLGDGLLIGHVSSADETTREKMYRQAIDLLVRLQKETASHKKEDCVALQRSFDGTLLNWEFDHFREYLVEARLSKTMDASDRELFEDVTREITEKITRMPYIFTHRDFQSKNLIHRRDGKLGLIDFQDALLGPYLYDLVALLRDSYVELDGGLLDKLVQYYAVEKGLGNIERVRRDFGLITLQRKMKDAGRFVYIDRVKKNPNFLQYMPATLRYVKAALEAEIAASSDAKLKKFYNMLKQYVPELR